MLSHFVRFCQNDFSNFSSFCGENAKNRGMSGDSKDYAIMPLFPVKERHFEVTRLGKPRVLRRDHASF